MGDDAVHFERLTTGVPGLDDILGGGFLARRVYLIEGDPGAGKTTLALQFLLDGVNSGERCLYITLSETSEELHAGARSHGWSLDGIEIFELIDSDYELESDARMTMYHPAEVELSRTTTKILEAVEQHNPTRVVFDSLSELRLLAQSSLRYRREILAFKQFFVGRNCTVLLLDDRTSEGSDLQLQSIAHGAIALEQLAPVFGAERRRLRVMKMRGSAFRGGFHDFSIRRGGIVVFPRLVAAEHQTEFVGGQIKSGVESIDALLGGGPDYGTSTLLMGQAGTGKSTVAMQYAVAAARRGEKAAIFIFDESVATLKTRCDALGIHFDVGPAAGHVEIHPIDPAEVSPGEFASMVRSCVETNDARVVVIDSLTGYSHAMPEERFLTAQLHELLSYLGRRGVATLMIEAQHGLLSTDMRSSFDTSYLADTIMLFRYFEHAGTVRKAISVVKKRSGLHEETIRELHLDPSGIRLSEPLKHFRDVLSGSPKEVGSK